MSLKNRIGKFLFKFRSFTPLPLIIVLFLFLLPKNFGEKNILFAIFGFLLIVIGEGIRIVSIGFSYPGTSGRESYMRADNLNISGIYSIVRNPLYIGNILIYSGLLVTYSNFIALVIFDLILIIQYFFIVNFEESYLLEKFGDKYSDYKKNTKAIFPCFKNFKKPVYKFNILRVLYSENDSIFNSMFLFFIILIYKEKLLSGELSALGPLYFVTVIILIVLYIWIKIIKKRKKKID